MRMRPEPSAGGGRVYRVGGESIVMGAVCPVAGLRSRVEEGWKLLPLPVADAWKLPGSCLLMGR
jgi:hypothetical protein